MRMMRVVLALLLPALVLPVVAQAQVATPFSVGARVSAAVPTGDFGDDASVGLGVGA
jgi:hypothetical protein